MTRCATVSRKTRETEVCVELGLDTPSKGSRETGLPFLDHMLDALALHGRLSLDLEMKGDLEVDDHHTVEDTALALGAAFDEALGDRCGIERFGCAYAPLDEALARAVWDFSGRPFAEIDLGLQREMIGTVATENLEHFFVSFATSARACLHLEVLRGRNDHHRAEAAFKAAALALRVAVARPNVRSLSTSDSRPDGPLIPSTKGSLT